MPSETDFLNGALGLAGCGRITNINDGSNEADWCKTHWGDGVLRQALLRAHHWNFAEARASLVAEIIAPTFEFAFAYGLPSKLAKIKEYNGDAVIVNPNDPYGWMTWPGRYKIEGKKLLTNDSIVLIVYVQDIDEPGLWDPLFYQMAQRMLGSMLARSINKDTNKAASLEQSALNVWLPIAAAVDGQEGTAVQYIVDDLLRGR